MRQVILTRGLRKLGYRLYPHPLSIKAAQARKEKAAREEGS